LLSLRLRQLVDRVFELRANVSAYHAPFGSVAEALRRPLVTADARLMNSAGPSGVIEHFTV
jgi:predicted nucleic acid-binding protein